MTHVDFHFNVGDKASLLSDLVERALQRRQQVMIAASGEQAAHQVSRALWAHKQTSFLPHALLGQTSNAPVFIHWGEAEMIYDEVLINLTAQQPNGFSRFKQLIELVGLDEEEKAAARQRYKFYRDRGYAINNVDQATRE